MPETSEYPGSCQKQIPKSEKLKQTEPRKKKNSDTFSLKYWLFNEGILVTMCYNPHVTGQYNPLYTLNNQVFFHYSPGFRLLIWPFNRVPSPKKKPTRTTLSGFPALGRSFHVTEVARTSKITTGMSCWYWM